MTELKRAATLGFDEGLLSINLSGYGDKNGYGRISFKEDDLDWGDGEDSHWRFMTLPTSELEAIRDFLNEQLPVTTGAASATLRDRCREFYARLSRDAMLRQGDPVESVVAFVISEQGRAADNRLDSALPLCLYFATAEDRREFVELLREAKPGMVMKEVP